PDFGEQRRVGGDAVNRPHGCSFFDFADVSAVDEDLHGGLLGWLGGVGVGVKTATRLGIAYSLARAGASRGRGAVRRSDASNHDRPRAQRVTLRAALEPTESRFETPAH